MKIDFNSFYILSVFVFVVIFNLLHSFLNKSKPDKAQTTTFKDFKLKKLKFITVLSLMLVYYVVMFIMLLPTVTVNILIFMALVIFAMILTIRK